MIIKLSVLKGARRDNLNLVDKRLPAVSTFNDVNVNLRDNVRSTNFSKSNGFLLATASFTVVGSPILLQTSVLNDQLQQQCKTYLIPELVCCVLKEELAADDHRASTSTQCKCKCCQSSCQLPPPLVVPTGQHTDQHIVDCRGGTHCGNADS